MADTTEETAAADIGATAAAGPATRQLRITQIGSAIGRKGYQRANLVALGLNKMHRSRIVPATPSMLGRIERVKHLLKVEQL